MYLSSLWVMLVKGRSVSGMSQDCKQLQCVVVKRDGMKNSVILFAHQKFKLCGLGLARVAAPGLPSALVPEDASEAAACCCCCCCRASASGSTSTGVIARRLLLLRTTYSVLSGSRGASMPTAGSLFTLTSATALRSKKGTSSSRRSTHVT